MKKFLSFVSVSALGGSLALFAYTQWLQPKFISQNGEFKKSPVELPVNYTPNPDGGSNVDFTLAAEKNTTCGSPR